jgi:hypothetical protein
MPQFNPLKPRWAYLLCEWSCWAGQWTGRSFASKIVQNQAVSSVGRIAAPSRAGDHCPSRKHGERCLLESGTVSGRRAGDLELPGRAICGAPEPRVWHAGAGTRPRGSSWSVGPIRLAGLLGHALPLGFSRLGGALRTPLGFCVVFLSQMALPDG